MDSETGRTDETVNGVEVCPPIGGGEVSYMPLLHATSALNTPPTHPANFPQRPTAFVSLFPPPHYTHPITLTTSTGQENNSRALFNLMTVDWDLMMMMIISL